MTATFPALRMRRLRQAEPMRRMVRETTLAPSDFIYPMFIVPGNRSRTEVSSMPGVFQLSAAHTRPQLDKLVSATVAAAKDNGLIGAAAEGAGAQKVAREAFRPTVCAESCGIGT